MADLILDSLEIHNFRAFRHLRIEKLGRVNLITGKNNVGKTCLLEALVLYVRHGEPDVIMGLLSQRGEFTDQDVERQRASLDMQERSAAVKSMFFGRTETFGSLETINIGPLSSSDDTLAINLSLYTWQQYPNGTMQLNPLDLLQDGANASAIPTVEVHIGDHLHLNFPLDQSYANQRLLERFKLKTIPLAFVPASGLVQSEILWDMISLTDAEKDVISALQIIAPALEGLILKPGNLGPRQESP